jgi:hypothetical protein
MVNGIVECSVRDECETFIKKITQNEAAISKLASSYHPHGEDCTVFGLARGSFNYCLFVEFNPSAMRWVVRIPLIPRLAFVDEKLDAEIATMKYVPLRKDKHGPDTSQISHLENYDSEPNYSCIFNQKV